MADGKTMAVADYAEYMKASLADMSILVDDLVAAEADGKIEVSEAVVIAMKHIITNIGIWGPLLPFFKR